jgi:hypothetical protein
MPLFWLNTIAIRNRCNDEKLSFLAIEILNLLLRSHHYTSKIDLVVTARVVRGTLLVQEAVKKGRRLALFGCPLSWPPMGRLRCLSA